MKISAILATKGMNVVTIRQEKSIREALALLSNYNIGALVVADDAASAPIGIISERDIVRRAVRDEKFLALSVREVMTGKVVTGTPGDDLDAVLHTMTENHFRHLPIVDAERGKLVGIVTIGDVVKARLDQYRGEVDTLQTQVS